MATDRPAGRSVRIAIAAALLALSGCGESAPPAPALAEPAAAIAETMSYEVAIAIAAADRNRAIRDCGARPELERRTCITVAHANWEIAKAAVDDLRGDQP
jgi:hypothetical protein